MLRHARRELAIRAVEQVAAWVFIRSRDTVETVWHRDGLYVYAQAEGVPPALEVVHFQRRVLPRSVRVVVYVNNWHATKGTRHISQ
jgi:hypothetical protein